jgi:3-dehydroquinate synthetase
MRGVAWVNLPTSLLSMVDSSLGGKTGINLPSGKNLAVAFFPPRGVLVDPAFLATLPLPDFRNGMAEVIKHGVIADPRLFERCEHEGLEIRKSASWLLPRAIAVKARVIVQDPYEQGERASLNFGHTIGHAVEKGLAYQVSHGEAVSIGMVIETYLAERLGLAESGLSGRVADILAAFGLPTDLPEALTTGDILTLIQHDKKRADGRIPFALPEAVGRVRVGVVVDDLEDLLQERRM